MYTLVDEDADDENLDGWCDNNACTQLPESSLFIEISVAMTNLLSDRGLAHLRQDHRHGVAATRDRNAAAARDHHRVRRVLVQLA